MYRLHRGIMASGNGLEAAVRSFGPAAWYQPGVGVTGTLTASNWADQALLDGTRDLAQGTAGNQPIYLPYSGTAYAYLPGVAGNTFQTPDAAGNRFAGDVDFRVKAALDSWTAASQTLVSKDSGGADRGFILYLNSGTVTLFFTTDGSTGKTANSSAAVSFTAGSTNWIRVTLASATGKVNFYTSSDGSTWSALGTEQTVTAGAIFDSTHTVEVGSFQGGTWPMTGKVYEVALYRGIAGTLASTFQPSTFAETSTNGATATASTGEVWTLNSTGAKPAQVVKSASLLFDGADDFMVATFTLPKPVTIYDVLKQNVWTSNHRFSDGVTLNSLSFLQNDTTPKINVYDGSFGTATDGLALGAKGITCHSANGAASLIQINAGTPSTFTLGTTAMAGITVGTQGDLNTSVCGAFQLWERLVFTSAHSAAERSVVQNYLAATHRIAL